MRKPAEGLSPCARSCSFPPTTRSKLGKGAGHRRRRADPRPGGCGQRRPQGARRARMAAALHQGDRAARQAAAALRAHQRARHALVGGRPGRRHAGARPDGILLPKARSGEDVHTLSIALNHAEERSRHAEGRDAHHRARHGDAGLAAAAAHLCRRQRAARWPDLGRGGPVGRARRAQPTARPTGAPGRSPYRWRAICACSRRWRPKRSRSTPCSSISATRRACARRRCAAARDGFTGKMAIHPNQVAVINEVFTPSAGGDRAWRRRSMRAFADNPDAGALASRADGRQGARRRAPSASWRRSKAAKRG